jgi:hypothetical protein
MPRRAKNPNVERVAHVPFDKDRVSPVPQITPRAPGAGSRIHKSPGTAPAREEYPGPQTASSGHHVEPGQMRPTKPRER